MIVDLLLVLFVAFHMVTLTRSPIVWLDEVGFHSLSVDFFQNGTLFQHNDPSFLGGQQLLFYGPLYFLTQSIGLYLFGTGMFVFRAVPLLAGILILLIFFYLVQKKEGMLPKYEMLVLSAFFLDPFYNSSMHHGRMDLMAILFLFISFLVLINSENTDQARSGFKLIFSGVFFGAAVMTTLRVAFFLLPYVIYIVQCQARRGFHPWELVRDLVLWGFPTIIFLTIWFMLYFGSLGDMLHYFQLVSSYHPDTSLFSFSIPVEEYPLLLITLITLLLILILGKGQKKDYRILVFLITYTLSFYLFVNDVGPYSVFIIPSFYGILFLLPRFLKVSTYGLLLTFLLLLFNSGVFVAKSALLFTSWDFRDYQNVEQFVREKIPEGSRVIADDMYYYAIVQHQCDYRYAFPLSTVKDRNRHYYENLMHSFDYDYILVSDRFIEKHPGKFDILRRQAELQLVSVLNKPNRESFPWMIDLLPYDLSVNGYNGKLYKRIR